MSDMSVTLAKSEFRTRVTLTKTMKDCSTLLRELVAMDPYKIFTEPVDAVAFSLPDYNKFIKTPMDFRTLRQRMTYTEMSPTEFAQLVNLIFDNALHYNGASKNCLVCVEARRLKNHFNDKYESLSRNREVEKKSPKIFTTLQTPTKVVDQSKGPVTLSKIMRDCSSLLQELIKSDAHKIFTEAVDAGERAKRASFEHPHC